MSFLGALLQAFIYVFYDLVLIGDYFVSIACLKAAIVQPVSDKVAIILGADKPRPFTGTDFGWLQAVSDRLGGVIDARRNA